MSLKKNSFFRGKVRIISFFALIIITLLGLYFLSTTLLNKFFKFSTTGEFVSVKEETNLVSAVNKLIEGQDEIAVKIEDNTTCYWIKSTSNETNYILRMNEYGYSGECSGFVKNSVDIGLSQWLNVYGDTSCICKGEYLLKMEKGSLKINKR
jgi:hypothetical protein